MKYSTIIAVAGLMTFGVASAQTKAPAILASQKANVEMTQVKEATVQTGATAVANKAAAAKGSLRVAPKAGLSAEYALPEGVFYSGITTERRSGKAMVRGGAYVDYTFTNQSEGAASYLWTYPNFEGEESNTTTDVDLTFKPGFATFDLPVLMATAADGAEAEYESPFSMYQGYAFTGGASSDLFSDGSEVGVGTFDAMWDPENGWTRGAIFGYPTYERWDQMLQRRNLGSDAKYVAYCNYFWAPNAPYYITKVWSWIWTKSTSDYTLTCQIREVTVEEDGNLMVGNVIAMGEAVVAASRTGTNVVPVFEMESVDEEGLSTDEPITITGAIMVEISGFAEADVTECMPIWPDGHHCGLTEDGQYVDPTHENHAFNLIEYKDNDGNTVTGYFDQPAYYYGDDEGTFFIETTDFAVWMDACYAFCNPFESEVAFAEEGETKEDAVRCYWDLIQGEACEMTTPEWLTANFDVVTVGEGEDAENYQGIIMTAEALPEGVEGREGEVVISGIGMADCVIKVTQGATAIAGVEADKTVVASEYYDIMGRKLNAQPENGMFIQKNVMNDGTVKSVKIAK